MPHRALLNCEVACYFQPRGGVGWGGDGLFNSYTSRDSLYDISAPQAKFFECSARLRSRKRDF